MFKTSDTFATFVASRLLSDADFRQLCRWLVARDDGLLDGSPAVQLAASVIADDESRQHDFHETKRLQAKARKEKAEKAEFSAKAKNAEKPPTIPFRSVPFRSNPVQENISTVPVSVSVETETETGTGTVNVKLNDDVFFSGKHDAVILARAVTGDNKRLSCRTWRKEIARIGEDMFLQELFTFWREIRAGEDCQNRGAAFTKRIKAIQQEKIK